MVDTFTIGSPSYEEKTNYSSFGTKLHRRPARAHKANIDCRFCRTRTGDQIGGAQHVEELLARKPLPLTHHFFFHHRDVGCRSTEAGGTEFKEEQGEFAQPRQTRPGVRRKFRRKRSSLVHAALCSPRRKVSMRRSEVRSENARMLMVVVLSVQFRNTLALHT